MYNIDPSAHAQAVIEYRVREASNRRLAREAKRSERPATLPVAAPKARDHSHLWNLFHFRQAHGAYS